MPSVSLRPRRPTRAFTPDFPASNAVSANTPAFSLTSTPNFKISGDVWVLCGEIDHPTCREILLAAHTVPHDRPLLFLIDSEGGLAHSTLGLLRELKPFTAIETRAIGTCASAAVHLLQAGQKRTAYNHAAFFTHALSLEGADVSSATADDLAASFARDHSAWIDALYARTRKKSKKFWHSFFQVDRNFNAEEALKLGLVDEII
jgi:ATP-dependent protease ClpP protease subunit